MIAEVKKLAGSSEKVKQKMADFSIRTDASKVLTVVGSTWLKETHGDYL